MKEFIPGPTATVYDDCNGQEIWTYINGCKERLETAVDLKRPPVEALGVAWMMPEVFSEFFGSPARETNPEQFDLLKRMVGRMVRQVLESGEYKLDIEKGSSSITRKGNIFKSGAQYERKLAE